MIFESTAGLIRWWSWVGYKVTQHDGNNTVLDDQFAEQYQRDIELIKENKKHLALLSKNQTSVIEAEYNVLRRSEETIEKQYKLFHQHLLNLERLTNNLQHEIESQELAIEFVMSPISANSFIEHLRNVQEILLDTVTNIYNGKMNLHLIVPEQLRDELNIISGQLSQDVALPITNIQEDFFRLYHLLQVRARMLQRYLIIEIRMPLISRETFEVYNLIPIPKKKGVDMVTLLPLAEIVAINIHKNSYLPMTVTDLHQCTHYDSTTLLCPIRTPEYHMKSDESLCKRNKGSLNCKTNHEGCRNIWWELNKINSYLYFCCDACKIRVICGNQVTTETLINAGVMTLGIDCTINSETFTVHSQRLSTDTIHTQVEEVTLEIPPINEIINLSVPELKQEPENEMKEQSTLLQDLGKQIEQLKAATPETNLSDRATYHDVHQYVHPDNKVNCQHCGKPCI
ncbi:uncharacterized protein LOC113506876 [Trichoplusia ni]|uniref:Uncharacterized protein LOC113506876 n=1 Tax=Trichoplusia ni TaxID=7111 RepID=A0A7E5WXE5_TRINI|nr:uncharacterized protein LOC113506876 [Trichoplusia ni]